MEEGCRLSSLLSEKFAVCSPREIERSPGHCTLGGDLKV